MCNKTKSDMIWSINSDPVWRNGVVSHCNNSAVLWCLPLGLFVCVYLTQISHVNFQVNLLFFGPLQIQFTTMKNSSYLLLPEIQLKKKSPPPFFWLKDNCFTILCWFPPHSHMNQPQESATNRHLSVSLEPALISLSIHPCVVSELWVELPANSHLVSISHMVMYMFPCSSLNLSHLLLLPLDPQVRSLCLHLHCCLANLSL